MSQAPSDYGVLENQLASGHSSRIIVSESENLLSTTKEVLFENQHASIHDL